MSGRSNATPCDCGALTAHPDGVCRHCRAPLYRSCLMCGEPTLLKDRVCAHRCRGYIRDAETYRPKADEGIGAGEWLGAGGVLRWRAGDDESRRHARRVA